jgi:iron(III) transport system substrate-binding protein
LINHYYWFEKAAEVGEENVTARIHYLDSDDPGALINVAGVGIVTDSDQQAAAEEAVSFLLSETGQQYFADTTAEYPVVDGITTSEHDIVPLNQLTGHQIDLNDLASLEETLALLDEVGLT